MISAKGERERAVPDVRCSPALAGLPVGRLFLALIASAAAEDAPAGVEARVTEGRLTLQADGAPLAEVLRAIGAAGGFEVVLRGAFATRFASPSPSGRSRTPSGIWWRAIR